MATISSRLFLHAFSVKEDVSVEDTQREKISRKYFQELMEQWHRATEVVKGHKLWLDLQAKECKEVEKNKIKEQWLRVREVIHGQKSWQDLQPRRVHALIGRTGKDETELSYHTGAASCLVGRQLA